VIVAYVYSDAIKPSLRVCGIDPAKVAEQPQKNFLGGILRVLQAAEQAVGNSLDHLLMLVHQPLKRVSGAARPGFLDRARQYQLSNRHFTREYATGGESVERNRGEEKGGGSKPGAIEGRESRTKPPGGENREGLPHPGGAW